MRNVELHLESGDQLDVRHFNVLESLSAAFRIDVVARAADDAIDLHRIIGRPATFRLNSDHGPRTWTGVVADVAQSHVEPEGLSTYTVTLAPALWLLTHRRNHRMFQHLSVPEIVQKIFREWHLPLALKLKDKYPKLALRTQYGETDYDFVRRLLAEAGISFYFHSAEGEATKVVLSDAPHVAEPKRDAPVPFARDASLAQGEPHVTDVHVARKVVPHKATVRDYDFRRPRFALAASHGDGAHHPLLEDYRFVPGHSLAEAAGGGEPVADGHGAYRHHDDVAATRARHHAEAHQAAATKVSFATSLNDLEPGTIFSMGGHPHPEVGAGKKLLVTHAWINGDVGGDWHTGGHAVPADKPYRPSATHAPDHHPPAQGGEDPYEPLARIVKPRIQGVQNAIVTGPAGEDVYTDEHGRVKLQFAWDRDGHFDEHSSPWVRVSQAWAGAGFGSTSLPRVGQEVLVAYQDGDPDHPVVVGRLHNATAPVPYPLPDNKHRTSWKSNGSDGANEITFEDKQQGELFYMHAQRDLHKIVENDELEHTQGSRHVEVDGDLVLSAKGSVIIHAGADLVVKGGPHVKINPSEKPKAPKKPKPLAAKRPPEKTPPAPKHPPHEGGSSNDRLKHMNPGHLPDSIAHAAAQRSLAEKYKKDAIKLGKKYGVPPALILGLMSRESDFGTSLDSNGRGDHGHGYGILQVDVGTISNPRGGPYSYEHLDQAMGIFEDKLHSVKAAHPGWTSDQQLAGAVAAYNAGAGNIQTQPRDGASWAQMDKGTTGDDYSRDTWARSQWFADHLDW